MINVKIYPINDDENDENNNEQYNVGFEQITQIIIPQNEVFIYNDIQYDRNYYSALYNKLKVYIIDCCESTVMIIISLIVSSSIIGMLLMFFIGYH